MDRREIEDLAKTKGSAKTRTSGMVGGRHADPGETVAGEGNAQSGIGNAMEAVREVVQSEGSHDKTKAPGKGAPDRAMDAIREIVEKE